MDGEAIQGIIGVTKEAAGARILIVGDVPIAAVSKGSAGVELQSLKKFEDERRGAPDRTKGQATSFTLESFIQLVKRHANEDSVIFGRADGSAHLLAVIDYTKRDHAPAFGTHRIRYDFGFSDEWKAWAGIEGRSLDQVAFASFMEDHISDLASPLDAERSLAEPLFRTKIGVPSEIMQLSRGLEINVDSKVKEIRHLQSGEAQISYDEVHKDGAGQPLTVPGLFVVSVPLFVGAEPSRFIARLRYRRADGIKWSVHFWRAKEAIREAVLNDMETVQRETALPVYEGSPEQ